MPDLKTIRKEIIEEVSNRLKGNPKFLKAISKVNEELDILSSTNGLEQKNNLETFYAIWKKNQGKVGHKNEINSWTACFLGMTETKPKKGSGFVPTRRCFARAGFPDIDTDFDDEKRDSVYGYIIAKYGRENVGNIGTHGRLKFKSCVTRVVKALDVAGSFLKSPEAYISDNAQKVTEILEPFPKKGLMKVIDEDGNEHLIKNFKDAYRYCPDFAKSIDKNPEIKTHAEHIEGTFANFGCHAAGVAVSDVPLDEIAPLRTARKGMLATQFPNEDLETLGLIKFDILAIATLSVIKNTVEMIRKNYDITIDIENLPLDDQMTFEMYRTGNLGGVFQCENWGMQRTMRDIKVDSFGDIIAGLALYRPGPMDSIPKYCARKNGEEEVSYFHPSIEPHVKKYLENTYGILCYQEQVMQICNSLAGFTITDGYIMIKAIGKKKEYLMNKFKEQFIGGCVKNGVDEYVATEYWNKFITPFASYGFNLAHSACYGYNSYTTAYLKAHYPEEFMCSFLNVITHGSGDKFDKIEAFEREFKRKMNVKFLSRDINRSKVEYIVEKSGDRCGGTKIEMRPSLICKGVGFKAAGNIEQNQPFGDLGEFVEKIDTSIVDTRVVEALAIGGYWGKKHVKDPLALVKKFTMIRDDRKKSFQKGLEPGADIFG